MTNVLNFGTQLKLDGNRECTYRYDREDALGSIAAEWRIAP